MDGEFRAHVWGGDEAWLNQRVCLFKPRPDFCTAFVQHAIVAPLALVEATETATTVIHLGKSDIDKFKFVMPTRQVLDAFKRSAQPWLDVIVSNKRESRTLAQLRDLLLPRLLSGELRVRDAEREVGRVA
jgi:type I restriction enzyme S subunit